MIRWPWSRPTPPAAPPDPAVRWSLYAQRITGALMVGVQSAAPGDWHAIDREEIARRLSRAIAEVEGIIAALYDCAAEKPEGGPPEIVQALLNEALRYLEHAAGAARAAATPPRPANANGTPHYLASWKDAT